MSASARDLMATLACEVSDTEDECGWCGNPIYCGQRRWTRGLAAGRQAFDSRECARKAARCTVRPQRALDEIPACWQRGRFVSSERDPRAGAFAWGILLAWAGVNVTGFLWYPAKTVFTLDGLILVSIGVMLVAKSAGRKP